MKLRAGNGYIGSVYYPCCQNRLDVWLKIGDGEEGGTQEQNLATLFKMATEGHNCNEEPDDGLNLMEGQT